jgi:hypothetical protein
MTEKNQRQFDSVLSATNYKKSMAEHLKISAKFKPASK